MSLNESPNPMKSSLNNNTTIDLWNQRDRLYKPNNLNNTPKLKNRNINPKNLYQRNKFQNECNRNEFNLTNFQLYYDKITKENNQTIKSIPAKNIQFSNNKPNYKRSIKHNQSCPIINQNNYDSSPENLNIYSSKKNNILPNNYDNKYLRLKKPKTFYHKKNIERTLLETPIKVNKNFSDIDDDYLELLKFEKSLQKLGNFSELKYKKLFEKRIPLNYLRYYKKYLLDDYIPKKFSQKILLDKKNQNGTKILINDENLSLDNEKEDYHHLMKNPFSISSFGYKFIRNKKKIKDLNKNPLNDFELINKIRNLIVNPNTREFRNEALLKDYKKKYKNKKLNTIDYKFLSKNGIEKIRKIKMNKYATQLEKNNEIVEDIKIRYDKLLEKNKREFIQQKQEVENEEDDL